MISLSFIYYCIIGLHLLAIIVLYLPTSGFRELPSNSQMGFLTRDIPKETSINNSYRFNNPRMAYEVFKQLDVFDPVDDGIFKTKVQYDVPKLGLRNDD